MEPIVFEEDLDVEDVDVNELCEVLNKSAKQIADLYNETFLQVRGMRKKLREETTTMDKQPLKAKAHVKRWIAAHGLPERPCFHEFFAVVCEELAKENRLDLSRRMLTPTKEIAKLFKVEPDTPIHILEFLGKAPEVFR